MTDRTTPNRTMAKDSEALARYQTDAMEALLKATAIGTPIVGFFIFQREGWAPLTLLALLVSVILGGLWLLLKRGHFRLATLGLVILLLVTSTGAIIYNGSVRSGAAYILLASVVIAGSFLSRAVALATGAYIIAFLGIMNWLEQQGALLGTLRPTGWTVWIIQSVVMATLLITSLYGRYRLMQVVQEQEAALRTAQAAKASLRTSQMHFEALFQRSPLASVVQSISNDTILDTNAAFSELFGYSRDYAVGQILPDLWANEAERLAFRQMLASQGQVSSMRATGRRADGSFFTGLVHAEVLPQGDEQVAIIMVLDISAETASRKELENSSDRFAKIFQSSPMGIVITREADNRIIEINRANEQVLGRPRSSSIGKTPLEAGIWYSEADRLALVQKVRTDRHLAGHETRMLSSAGEPVPVRIWSEPIELGGEACRLTFMLNIAEEKQREATLINIAEGVSGATGEAFFLSLAEHLARAVNADGILIAEKTQPGELDSWALIDQGQLQPNRSIALNSAVYDRIMASSGMVVLEELSGSNLLTNAPRLLAANRTLAGLPLRDGDGSNIGLLLVTWQAAVTPGNDLRSLMSIFGSRCAAELVRLRRDREIGRLNETLEQRVAARTAQLEYLNRELDAFAYSVSHDLKSPLRSIDGFLHMLHDQMADRMLPADEELFQRASSSASRMGGLISDLLSLARVSQGQLQRMDVNLNELVDSVIRHERDRDPTHDIEILIEPGMRANCDPRMAEIVLENLIGNAWKYAHKQAQPRMEIGQEATAEGEPAVFYVKDNGAGFDAQLAGKLFKPFSRLHTAAEFEGSGIGLATVRRILERHGGHIRAQSTLGQGACFWFSFGHATVD